MQTYLSEVLLLIQNTIVTSALPYANANQHMGHLRSTYLPADIYTRYLRLRGRNVIYICATDEHGTPISVKAEKESTTPKAIVDVNYESIIEDLTNIGCSFDYFGRTTSQLHHTLTQDFFTRLFDKGYIYKDDYEQLYCSHCHRFLPDRYVEGQCPQCGGEKARGDACDSCGRYLKPIDLKNPYCVTCGEKPEIRSTEHWFFKLSTFQNFLENWIEDCVELPNNVKNYAVGWLREGLKDWCITRDMNWGVAVPHKQVTDKVIYVWFDAPIGYISSTMNWAKLRGKSDEWKNFWLKETSNIIHFIGKDIIYHHVIFWPAMLHAHGQYRLPSKIIAGEYLTLEGKKMSKSRQWVVEVKDYLKKYDPDPLRYYLIAVAPLTKDADFSWNEFIRKNNDELADILGNFVHRTLTFTYQFFNQRIPYVSELEAKDKDILKTIKAIKHEVEKYLEIQEFHRAIRSLMELSMIGNRYLNEKEPWTTIKTNPSKAATTLYISCQIVKALVILLAPFLPFTAEKLWEFLNLPDSVHQQHWNEIDIQIAQGHRIRKPRPLFKKLELTPNGDKK